MEITQDKINLISSIIKNNGKFSGNEDLYDDFLNEACQRSLSIINAIDNEATLTSYLQKVVTTSIVRVLKDSGRLRRSKTGYMSTNEISLDTVAPHELSTSAPVSESANESVNLSDFVDYSHIKVNYADAKIPYNPEENALHNEVINFVADTLESINEQEPEKKYMDIFIMRYDKALTQKQMAQELGISQSEVSKRIYSLLDKVKSVLDEQ